jgi:hypothetical protein
MSNSDDNGKPRQVRLVVEVPKATLAAVDDYRIATRVPNRSEAVRRLLKVGQAASSPKQSN